MIKSLFKQNKLAQRIKAIKDLVLEKLDSLNLKADQQAEIASLLLTETAKTHQSLNHLLEDEALLLKFSVDMVQGLQRVAETSQQQHQNTQETAQHIYQSIGESYQENQKNSEQIYQEFQKIREESQSYYQLLIEKILAIETENQTQNRETRQILEQVYTDIHNQKFKIVSDPTYFQAVDIELMVYLYSFLPHRRAIDIGANRGDVSSRLLQVGYEVYAFEPFPPVFTRLQDRLENNPRFHPFPLALGATEETRELHIVVDQTEEKIYDDPTFYSSLTRHSLAEGLVFSETVPVTVRTLANLHTSGEIPAEIGLVKIDTEGFDLEVIKGMGEYRYPVVVAEFWDHNCPFGQTGAMNYLKDMVRAMRERHYSWHIVIYRIWGSHDLSYYCNSDYSLDTSWGNVFFFQDYEVFSQALKWCSSVMPATYFSV